MTSDLSLLLLPPHATDLALLPYSLCAQSVLGSISYLFGSNSFIVGAVFHDIPIGHL